MSDLIHLSDAEFADKTKSGVTFVDFYADWCGPCQMMLPHIEELASEYKGKMTFAKVNVDENPETPELFHVRGIPTFVVLKDGKLIGTLTGAMPKPLLKARIEEALASAGAANDNAAPDAMAA